MLWAIREITREVPVHILCTFLIQFLSSLDSLIKALGLTYDLQIFFPLCAVLLLLDSVY